MRTYRAIFYFTKSEKTAVEIYRAENETDARKLAEDDKGLGRVDLYAANENGTPRAYLSSLINGKWRARD